MLVNLELHGSSSCQLKNIKTLVSKKKQEVILNMSKIIKIGNLKGVKQRLSDDNRNIKIIKVDWPYN